MHHIAINNRMAGSKNELHSHLLVCQLHSISKLIRFPNCHKFIDKIVNGRRPFLGRFEMKFSANAYDIGALNVDINSSAGVQRTMSRMLITTNSKYYAQIINDSRSKIETGLATAHTHKHAHSQSSNRFQPN